MTALASGLGFGLGLCLVIRGLRPARPTLATSLERTRSTPDGWAPASRSPSPAGGGGSGPGVGVRLATELDRPGLRLDSVAADLAIVGRPVGRFFADKALFALVGALLAPSVVAGLSLAGVVVTLVVPVWASSCSAWWASSCPTC